MKCKNKDEMVVLLPAYFKKIGLAVIVLSLVPVIIIKSMHIEWTAFKMQLLRIFIFDALILGLFFIAWSKDKTEDELTFLIRLKAAARTFTFAVFFVIGRSVVDLTVKNPIGNLTGQDVIIMMFSVYLVVYYYQKLHR